MDFGVKLPNCAGIVYPKNLVSKGSIIEIATKAEALRYSTLWTYDHLVPSEEMNSIKQPDFYESLVLLSHLSGITNSIRLGTSVIILPLRNPVVFAKQVTTLDILSGGRLDLGFGIGAYREEYEALGVEFKERGKLTNRYLRMLRSLWSDQKDDARFAGSRHRELRIFPKPKQHPLPPIWIGGNSEAAIRRTARFGNWWVPSALTPQEIESKLPKLENYAREHGKEPDEIEVGVSVTVCVGKTERDAVSILARPPHAHSLSRSLVGTADAAIRKIEQYEEVGVTHMQLAFPTRHLSQLSHQLNSFAEKVMPSFS